MEKISNSDRTYISKIKVKSLFGMYDYQITPPKTSDTNAGADLIILYGDNGCGKTTILEMLFYLLSCDAYTGHKTRLKEKPFKEFEVSFSNGYKVIAHRDNNNVVGTFTTSVFKNKKLINQYEYSTMKKSSAGTPEEELYMASLKALSEIGVSFHYLSQDRKLLSKKEENNYVQRNLFKYLPEMDSISELNELREGASIDTYLNRAVKEAVEWARNASFRATSRGSTSANSIYLELLRSLSRKDTLIQQEDEKKNLNKLKKSLFNINKEAENYSKHGLLPEIAPDIKLLLEEMDKTLIENASLIKHVLEPYIDGIEARLAAQSDLQQLLSKFTENMNGFLKSKELDFSLHDGIEIKNKDSHEKINIQLLSSGEKQLLLIMCNAISSRNKANIFIIDEPEISLNIKWQRGLVKALLDCTTGSNSQFILATHSIPLLTSYEENVINLTREH